MFYLWFIINFLVEVWTKTKHEGTHIWCFKHSCIYDKRKKKHAYLRINLVCYSENGNCQHAMHCQIVKGIWDWVVNGKQLKRIRFHISILRACIQPINCFLFLLPTLRTHWIKTEPVHAHFITSLICDGEYILCLMCF